MTNIGVIARRKENGDMDSVAVIADSQSTYVGDSIDHSSKSDRSLKIHAVGRGRDILLLGTGPRSFITGVADKLRSQSGIDTAEETAEAALQATDQMFKEVYGDPSKVHDEGLGLNFVVAGPSKNDLSVMVVNTTGANGLGKPDYGKRSAKPLVVPRDGIQAHFDGSAWRHINSYLAGLYEAGRPIVVNNLADAVVEIHDLSLRGTADLGVNDKFHYGLVVPGKSVRLVHPDTTFNDPEVLHEWYSRLFGLDVAGAVEKVVSKNPQEGAEGDNAIRGLRDFAADFYHALRSELDSSSALKRDYTEVAERLFKDKRYRGQFDHLRQLRQESLDRIAEGVNVMLSQDANQVKAYIDAHSARRAEANAAVLGRYSALNEKKGV
ncbi:MAG: hypothetical protein ABH864_07045 [archaeon]